MFELDKKRITSVDKKFLQRVYETINRHISDSSFGVEVLVQEVAISRSVLQRKILSLAGETPGELIRRIRLNKAAELIKQKFGNLSEIALEVGYNNPAHFSEAFKKPVRTFPLSISVKKLTIRNCENHFNAFDQKAEAID